MTYPYKNYGIYRLSDGFLDRAICCTEEILDLNVFDGEGSAELDSSTLDWYMDVDTNEWNAKTESALSVSNANPETDEEITISNIPYPCELLIDHTFYDLEESEADVSFSEPGQHRIFLQCAKHFKKEIFINVE